MARAALNPAIEDTVREYEPATDPETGGPIGYQEVTIIDEDVSGAKAALAEVGDFYLAALGVASTFLTFAIFSRASSGRPFDRRNVRDLRILAVLGGIGLSFADSCDRWRSDSPSSTPQYLPPASPCHRLSTSPFSSVCFSGRSR